MLDDPALLHAGRLADDANRDVDRDPLIAADGQEVDVHELAAHVVPLDLASENQVLLPVDLEIDQHVRSGPGVERAVHVPSIDRHRHGVHPVPVQHRGDLSRGAQPPSRTLAGCLARLCRQLDFHRRPSGR